MPQGAEKEKPGWRAWRRECRKGPPNPYDAHNQAEASNYQGGFFKKD